MESQKSGTTEVTQHTNECVCEKKPYIQMTLLLLWCHNITPFYMLKEVVIKKKIPTQYSEILTGLCWSKLYQFKVLLGCEIVQKPGKH